MLRSILVALFSLVATAAFAEADLSSFTQAKIAFASAHAPRASELQNALWMTTTIASAVDESGSYPSGRLPAGDGTFYREIAHFTVSHNGSVEAIFKRSEADKGLSLGSTRHTGVLDGKGLVLTAPGDAGSCATRSVCRTLASKTLLCAQANDDDRAVCTRSYKKGFVSSYIGYKPVHP